MSDPAQTSWELLVATRGAAWLSLGPDARLQACDGDLQRHGLSGLALGDSVDEVLPALASGHWPREHELLPRVGLPGGAVADLSLAPRPDGGLDVLLLDSRDEARLLGAHQQRSYELELERRAHRRPRHMVDTALTGLEAALFEQRPHGLMLLAPAPEWLTRLLGQRPHPGELVPLAEVSPFVEHFLDDAREVWNGPTGEHLRSGVFMQSIGEEELPLEATALCADDARLLLVQRLREGFEESRHVLQAARSNRLEYESLRREIQKKDLLLHCIVHDLNAPLSSIAGAFALLARGGLDAQRSARLLELGQEQSRRQMDMIRQILEVFSAEVASMESFDADPHTAPDLAAAVRRVAEALAPTFQQRGVELALHLPDTPLRVVGREDRLDRVLSNLLENALRHTPRQSRVSLSVAVEPDQALLTIDDQGPGVAPELAERLFEKFGQGAKGGVVGLGLYFCRFTVQQWGGSIGHEPVPGGGARFWFRLPRALPV